MTPPTFTQFQQLAQQGNVIPIADSLLADLQTPVSAFLRLCGDSDDGFLFESVEGGERFARYSFLGRDPRWILRFDGRHVVRQQGAQQKVFDGSIFDYIQAHFRRYRFVPVPGLPRFSGGLVGYFGYDTVRLLEQIPAVNPDDAGSPEALFGLFDTVLAFDHLRHQIHIITNVIVDDGEALRSQYDRALARIEETRRALRRELARTPQPVAAPATLHANFAREAFCDAVRQAKEYIRAGDIFQVVLSQRFFRELAVPPFDVYRALRVVNPSPYLYCFRIGGQHIIGSSPELLVRVENGEATVRPIAGTRPRGATPAEDELLAQQLLADEKERAEHVMLVDLGRNDLGRVSRFGSVRVTENMVIEKYSHVMHIVSEVRGTLQTGLDAIDAFKACFPAGTVSGAPKVRAMEIIEELEPSRRGVYAGALGYLDFSGNMDTCIAIRTIEICDGHARFQAGAGIVADSVPEKEYEETVHKSNALRTAIAMAENGL